MGLGARRVREVSRARGTTISCSTATCKRPRLTPERVRALRDRHTGDRQRRHPGAAPAAAQRAPAAHLEPRRLGGGEERERRAHLRALPLGLRLRAARASSRSGPPAAGSARLDCAAEVRAIRVDMGRATFPSGEIPVLGPPREVVDEPLRVGSARPARDLCLGRQPALRALRLRAPPRGAAQPRPAAREPRDVPESHQRAARARALALGDRRAGLGARRGRDARVRLVELRGRRGGAPTRPGRSPRRRAHAGRRAAHRDRRGLRPAHDRPGDAGVPRPLL